MNEPKVETNAEIKKIISNLEQVYANKFYLSLGQEGIIRLAFSDMIDENNEDMVICILMTQSGLMSLKMMIDSLIANAQNRAQIDTEPNKPDREALN